MHRWIFLTPWGTLRLHHILRSDEDRHLHDHPFDFTSFLLTGSYMEVQPDQEDPQRHRAVVRPRFSIVRKKAENLHKLILDKPVWTFVIGRPKRREWGFQTERGWIHHRQYVHEFPELADLESHADLRRMG